jgi:predicted ATPase/DNA-binding SARP family transcriptional activator/Flp pilus assembly protein TadD
MLYIHLLGHLRLFDSRRTFEFAALPKTLPLLTYLLLHREQGPLSRDKIAYTLWAEETEERAKANLRRHLYDLQQALPETAEDKPWLIRSRSTVHWNRQADYWLDVAEFEKLSESADHLAKAVTLYGGDLLPGVYEDWLDIYRDGFRQRYLDNLNQLVSRSRAQKDYRQAVAYVKQLLAYDPLQEDVMRDYLLLRYEQGDRAGAMQAYLEFVELLERELEVSPLPETAAVYEAIRDDKVAELAGQDGRDTVVVRTGEPEKNVNKLPAQLTSFFGRTLDLITVHDLFLSQKPATRLLTLTGPGGSGKTRLALELAARVLPKQAALFPDGIFFVDLSAVMQPEKVIETIADTLEVKEEGSQTILEALTAFVSSRYLLLILDNFEQVIDAGSIIVDLLEAAPGLRVMITSRAALQLYGEHEYPVSPLPLPNAERLPPMENLLEFAAVSLFVARARAYKSDFTLTNANARDIVTICSLLDGLPLAIELAAARIKLFSPKAMVAQLHSKLAFLSSRARNLPARQQTLRDTLDWSYQLLDNEEKKLFRRLALFRGSFTAEAVAEVALTPEGKAAHESMTNLALNLLVALSEKSMIQFGQSEMEGQPRFQMLSTVREYASEALRQEKQLTSLDNRYALYFAGLAEAALEGMSGTEQVKWVNRIQDEANNFQAALEWLLKNQVEERAQILLAYIIGLDLNRKGHFADAVSYYEMGVEKAKLIEDLLLLTVGWSGLADLYIERGENRQALWAAEQAEEFAQTLPKGDGGRERLELVRAVTLKGWALARLGEFDAALPVAERAYALSNEAGGAMAKLIAMNLLAYLYDDVGRYQEGAYYHHKAIAIARQNRDLAWETTLLNNLADSYMMMGNFEGAIEVLEDAHRLSRAVGYNQLETLVLANIGNAYLELGNFTEAENYLRRALDGIGDSNPFYLSFCYSLLGQACAYKGKVEEGLSFARQALQLAEELDNLEDVALAWHALADVAANHKERAVIIGRRPYTPTDCFEKGAGVFEENDQEVERARLLVKWAGYETAVGNKDRAVSLLQEAEAVFNQFDLPLFLAQVQKGYLLVR